MNSGGQNCSKKHWEKGDVSEKPRLECSDVMDGAVGGKDRGRQQSQQSREPK